MNRRVLLRFERGLTSGQVAQRAGVSRPTLRAFETGRPVSARVARSLADFYGLSVAELLNVTPEPTPDPDPEPSSGAA